MFVPVPSADPRFEVLADAAFGGRPALAAAGLPALSDPLATWMRAVALGGQGHYAAARAELTRLLRDRPGPVLSSLAASTTGSLLRQLGWHAAASGWDGRAAAAVLPGLAVADPAPGATAPDRVDAACDALTGLAADALGLGRLALAGRLLERARALLGDDETVRVRARIRLCWVAAETALAGGDAARALPHAEAGLRLAETGPSVRHRIKSALLVAAATAASGDHDRAAVLAEGVAERAGEHGLLPLRWATAMLTSGVAATPRGRTSATVEANSCERMILQLGGRFRPAGTC
ncbi:hypothetical protein [Nocardia higoensis]|uniref:hypothetical protein n=1 Tax=Nocardia higoensis TaxID=228599 RepID=UPI0002FF7BD9|nr:hypothetical protein [Nocardia higoensis]